MNFSHLSLPFIKTKTGVFYRQIKEHLALPPLKATFTVEAAAVLPIFIFAIVFIMIFFRILSIEWGITSGCIDTARLVAISGENGSSLPLETVVIGGCEANIVRNKVPTEYITGKQLGIDFSQTRVDEKDVDILVNYSVRPTINIFKNLTFDISKRIRMRRWVGYNPLEANDVNGSVYVTESGVAYHKDIDCVYLNPSIKAVNAVDISGLRNQSHGKYYSCDICGNGKASIYYIADYGRVYHTNISCKSLKRSIKSFGLDEAKSKGYHICPKCG